MSAGRKELKDFFNFFSTAGFKILLPKNIVAIFANVLLSTI
jgi:hypothetical protein